MWILLDSAENILITQVESHAMNQLKKKSPARASSGKHKRKSREELNAEGRERKRQKKHRGHPSGNRHQESNQKKQSGNKQEKDPRIGSKVAVPLIVGEKAVAKSVAEQPKVIEKPRLSAREELEMLENDERLDDLLARLEQGEKLSLEDNVYVDKMLDRIDVLMEELGIELEDDDSEEEKKEDIMQLLKGK
ncbi:Der GTPase-activating protein YihI [Xenorhabdus innexi]|uniref:Der GTPase-activating protein YihI n=2 Tax=Xenorhabdus innexi TaxID=290109 RepID=A0A1N6MR40_9GAMM|nr:GTPase-activating protein [Xenorhabdus innexi]SIP71295.1 Der GTPase-activating protein YihI [Xenorhabdus innexi]